MDMIKVGDKVVRSYKFNSWWVRHCKLSNKKVDDIFTVYDVHYFSDEDNGYLVVEEFNNYPGWDIKNFKKTIS